MASESDGEKRETLADIVADLRGRADCAERHGDRETHNDGVAMLLRSIADRIEAIDSADAWRSLYTPGNAAALREALCEIALDCQYAIEGISDKGDYGRSGLSRVLDKARAALSAPARNCDRFADAESARQAWLDDAENWDEFGSPKLELHEWLFAPAAERKGEGDGR